MDDINLLPGDFIAQQQRLVRLRIWIIVVAIILLGLPGGLLTLHWQLRAAEQQVVDLERQRAQLTQRLNQLKGLRERYQNLHVREESIRALVYRAPLQQLFFDIATLTDEDIWLTRIELRKSSGAGRARSIRPAQQRSRSFFTPGRTASSATAQSISPEGKNFSLVLQGFTVSNQRLADFMTGLATVQPPSKVDLQVARQGIFLTYEAIEFVIEIHL